jgi:crotonobetainyl-CoA:carnitine CoA-transferase CaiB-like acyl-CoA transferase
MRSWQDPELARDPRCATMRSRAAHAAELVPELRAALAMFDHPQVLAEDLVATLDHPVVGRYRTMTKPIKFSDTPGPTQSSSPTFGQHSDEILARHGYSTAEIAALREHGVVR